tara:strand:+ start:18191 stop:18757 length:567 start_codon:yes stop_codon:yes gene_type:complete
MSEVKDVIYVWQKSERLGRIVIGEKIDGQWLYFTDGSRINKTLVNEFLSIASSAEEAEQISKILIPAAPDSINKAESKPQPVQVVQPPKKEETSTSSKVLDTDDLMVGILEKISKKNKTNLEISVGVYLPSKIIFKALSQDVEEDELKRGLEKLIKKQINNIEDQLNNQIESFIQNYYYEQKRSKKSA